MPSKREEPLALRWSIEQRLEFIQRRLLWEGKINRADLVRRFGVSPNQATADLRRFETANPGALIYDTRAKTYRAGPGLAPAGADDVGALLREFRLIAENVLPPEESLLAAPPPLALAEAPLRRVEPQTLSTTLSAVRDHRAISASYQSFSSAAPPRRVLEPHAFVFDGFRWHVRARDVDENLFKDFVLGRLSRVAPAGPSRSTAEQDREWQEMEEIVIAPHPGLEPHQRAVIESDYGMRGGRLVLTCRGAVSYYLKRRLGLVPGHEKLRPNDQQIVLISP